MKAALLRATGGPEALQIEEVPIPEPGACQVLIDVEACGICGHDQADRTGLTRIDLPAILGHEISGVVVDVGPQVAHLRPGDRVAAKQWTTCGWCAFCRTGQELQCEQRRFNYGGFAEFAVLDEAATLLVPASVDLAGASIIACALGSCVRALRTVGQVMPGEYVLVTGAGGGLGAHGMQAAKAFGATTIAITTSMHKVDDLRRYGADAVVLAEGPDYWKQILELTAGHGADVVLDNVGHPAVFGPCFRALGRHGRYVFTGQVARQKIDFYPAFVLRSEATITGSGSTGLTEFITAMELVAKGGVKPVIQRFPLTDVAEAQGQMDKRQVTGRAVLIP
jgi:acryloyl-coenzyme A reductase